LLKVGVNLRFGHHDNRFVTVRDGYSYDEADIAKGFKSKD